MKDEALEVLRQVYDTLRPDIPWELVQRCYEVERTYQYEGDREIPQSKLSTFVTLAVDAEMGDREDLNETS